MHVQEILGENVHQLAVGLVRVLRRHRSTLDEGANNVRCIAQRRVIQRFDHCREFFRCTAIFVRRRSAPAFRVRICIQFILRSICIFVVVVFGLAPQTKAIVVPGGARLDEAYQKC